MDENKINCRECKRNNGFWAHVFRAIGNVDAEDVGKFLMISSLIATFIFSIIKLSSIMSLIDTLLVPCATLFFIGFLIVLFV